MFLELSKDHLYVMSQWQIEPNLEGIKFGRFKVLQKSYNTVKVYRKYWNFIISNFKILKFQQNYLFSFQDKKKKKVINWSKYYLFNLIVSYYIISLRENEEEIGLAKINDNSTNIFISLNYC